MRKANGARGWLMIALALTVLMLALAGCGGGNKETSSGQPAGPVAYADGSCVACHTSREKLVADLEANPLPVVEKSEETAGEG